MYILYIYNKNLNNLLQIYSPYNRVNKFIFVIVIHSACIYLVHPNSHDPESSM